jgi:putative transcription factor
MKEKNINAIMYHELLERISLMSKVPDCQDWTPVTFNKRTAAIATKTVITSSSLENVGVYKAASDDDIKKTKYVSKATSDTVKTARCEKKLTQKELAQKCSMDAAIISEVERGGGVYNAAHINKIQNALGVKIPR